MRTQYFFFKKTLKLSINKNLLNSKNNNFVKNLLKIKINKFQ